MTCACPQATPRRSRHSSASRIDEVERGPQGHGRSGRTAPTGEWVTRRHAKRPPDFLGISGGSGGSFGGRHSRWGTSDVRVENQAQRRVEAKTTEPRREVPISVKVSRPGYEPLEFSFRLADGPLPSRFLELE